MFGLNYFDGDLLVGVLPSVDILKVVVKKFYRAPIFVFDKQSQVDKNEGGTSGHTGCAMNEDLLIFVLFFQLMQS